MPRGVYRAFSHAPGPNRKLLWFCSGGWETSRARSSTTTRLRVRRKPRQGSRGAQEKRKQNPLMRPRREHFARRAPATQNDAGRGGRTSATSLPVRFKQRRAGRPARTRHRRTAAILWPTLSRLRPRAALTVAIAARAHARRRTASWQSMSLGQRAPAYAGLYLFCLCHRYDAVAQQDLVRSPPRPSVGLQPGPPTGSSRAARECCRQS